MVAERRSTRLKQDPRTSQEKAEASKKAKNLEHNYIYMKGKNTHPNGNIPAISTDLANSLDIVVGTNTCSTCESGNSPQVIVIEGLESLEGDGNKLKGIKGESAVQRSNPGEGVRGRDNDDAQGKHPEKIVSP